MLRTALEQRPLTFQEPDMTTVSGIKNKISQMCKERKQVSPRYIQLSLPYSCRPTPSPLIRKFLDFERGRCRRPARTDSCFLPPPSWNIQPLAIRQAFVLCRGLSDISKNKQIVFVDCWWALRSWKWRHGDAHDAAYAVPAGIGLPAERGQRRPNVFGAPAYRLFRLDCCCRRSSRSVR